MQFILIAAITMAILGLLGLLVQLRWAGASVHPFILIALMAVSGIAAAVLILAAAMDNSDWWYLPAGLCAVLFVTSMLTRPRLKVAPESLDMSPGLLPMFGTDSLTSMPKVVDFSKYIVDRNLNGVLHVQPATGVPCWVGPLHQRLSDLIKIAEEHECESIVSSTQVLRVVA